MWHELGVVFGWPNGIVTGNILADLIGLGFAIIFRDKLMRKLVVLHHKHHLEHLAKLAEQDHSNN